MKKLLILIILVVLLMPFNVFGAEITGFREYTLGMSVKEITHIAKINGDKLALLPYNKKENTITGTLILDNPTVSYTELPAPMLNFYNDKLYNILFLLGPYSNLTLFYEDILDPITSSLDIVYGKHTVYKGNLETKCFLWKSDDNDNEMVLAISTEPMIDKTYTATLCISSRLIEQQKRKEHPNRFGW